jgi:hypothetical protein
MFMKNPPLFEAHVPSRNQTARFLIWFGILLLQVLLSSTGWANIYATNIRFNGGTTNLGVPGLINIGYILNEPASRVTITINSGATTVRTIALTNPSPGTLRGTNLVAWDGKDSNGTNVGAGTYTVSITAATDGYEDWTQISDDANPGNYVWEGRGIGVNKNPGSPYYGRVFVANSHGGPNENSTPGDSVGILKLNADGSPADEAIESGFWNSTGGWLWAGDYYSPWKLEVSDDDKVYVNDFTVNGIVLSFDQTIAPASRQIVLNTNNYPSPGVSLSGPFITGIGSNAQVWMADIVSGGVGIRRWQVGTNGSVATNDIGTMIVKAGSGSDLNNAPFDVAVDRSNRIYTIQQTLTAGDPAYRVFRFPAYGGTLETNADWKIGNADDTFEGAHGLAVDPAGRYLAVAFIGDGNIGTGLQFGSTRVFETTNGTAVTTLLPSGNHDHRDVAWDNVGNLYTIDNIDSTWRTYSPPGTNEATTTATVTLEVATPITLSDPSRTGQQFQFTLNGKADVSYIIQASTNLLNWEAVVTNVSANATRIISVSAPGSVSFYRALVGP